MCKDPVHSPSAPPSFCLSFQGWVGDVCIFSNGSEVPVSTSFTNMDSSSSLHGFLSSELKAGVMDKARSGRLEKSSRRTLMGEAVTSQLVMPKSRRCARAWLERPALVSKPALQNSQCITLKVAGSKLATGHGAFRRTGPETEGYRSKN